MTEKEELLKVKNEDEFNEFLLKYHPNYDDIPADQWEQEIYRYYVEIILKTTIESIEKMDEEILEYDII